MEIEVCSGAQTGADQGGLEAAKEVGFKTYGVMPKGWKTQDGPRPEFAEIYGLIEHPSPKYPPRTYVNAKESDGTLRFAVDFNSSGEICTLKAIKQYDRPFLDIRLKKDENIIPTELSVNFVVEWIVKNNIERLNIAGNSNKTYYLMQKKVKSFLLEVFKRLKENYE